MISPSRKAKNLAVDTEQREMNQLITRTVQNTQPITVEYEITEYGATLRQVTDVIADWGIEHRKRIIGG